LHSRPPKSSQASSSSRCRHGLKCDRVPSHGGSNSVSSDRVEKVAGNNEMVRGKRLFGTDRSSRAKNKCKNDPQELDYEDFVSGLALEFPQNNPRKQARASKISLSGCGANLSTDKREEKRTARSFAFSDSAAEPEVGTNFRSLLEVAAHDRKSKNQTRHSASPAVGEVCKNLRMTSAVGSDNSCNKDVSIKTSAERKSTQKADNFRQSSGAGLGLLKTRTRKRPHVATPAGRRVARSAECDRVMSACRAYDRRPSRGRQQMAATSKVKCNSN
jgi:hypothetical protein